MEAQHRFARQIMETAAAQVSLGDSATKDKADVDDWMNGDRRIAWLRTQGYAK
jgi:hypothetical protein